MSNDRVDPEDVREVVVWALGRIGAAAMSAAAALPIAALITASQGVNRVTVLGVSLSFALLVFGLICVIGRPPTPSRTQGSLRDMRAEQD